MDTPTLPLHQHSEAGNPSASKQAEETNDGCNYRPPSILSSSAQNATPSTATLPQGIISPPPPPPQRPIALHYQYDSDDEEEGSYVDEYYRYDDEDDDDDEEAKMRRHLKFYLADRRYHLPGNNACEDWIQFFLNNHPVLGICCHHPLHPLKFCQRIVMLITSVAFGLGATSFVIMWYWYDQTADDKLVGINKFEVTKEMVAIFLFGSALHSVFDWMVWHTFACTACQRGGPLEKYDSCKWIGQHIGTLISMCTIGVSVGLVWCRATSLETYFSFQEFAFIAGYLLELVISLFVFSPLLSTVLFSGILGCYRIPVLGGRPWELRVEAAAKRRKDKKRLKKQQKLLQLAASAEANDAKRIGKEKGEDNCKKKTYKEPDTKITTLSLN